MGVLEEKAKRGIVHDMTFGGNREKGERGPVNGTTGWIKIPECELAEMINDALKRIIGLRAKFGAGRRITIPKMDVKSAFRQIGVYPAGAAAFGYVVADNVMVAVRVDGEPRVVVGSGERDAERAARNNEGDGDAFGGRDQSNIARKNCTHDGKKDGVVAVWV